MRIALIGYGKMGQLIDEIAASRHHEVVLRIRSSNLHEFTKENIQKADVVIEFTNPESAYENVTKCLSAGVPVVSGSTGWNDRLTEAKRVAEKSRTAFLHASNFSVGVNIFFEINKLLARLMAEQPEYQVSVKEIHHTQKKDAPSGTAVTIAEQIIANHPGKNSWSKGSSNKSDVIPVYSERIDPAPGTHHVTYSSEIDDIELIHTAHNRSGFALGAVIAAEFIKGKQGLFTMSDVLKLK